MLFYTDANLVPCICVKALLDRQGRSQVCKKQRALSPYLMMLRVRTDILLKQAPLHCNECSIDWVPNPLLPFITFSIRVGLPFSTHGNIEFPFSNFSIFISISSSVNKPFLVFPLIYFNTTL